MNNNLADLLKEIAASTPQNKRNGRPTYLNETDTPQSFDSKVEQARAKKIRNDNRVSDQQMKKHSLRALFTLLAIETAALFTLAFLQGFGGGEGGWFHINEWCFNILTGATLSQIAYMLTIAIKHLFPTK